MFRIIELCLLYLFVMLNLKFYYKSIFRIIKSDFYVFAFFVIFLVRKAFDKYTIRCKIKFHVEVT
jgi:hypothetical protein